MSWVIIDCSRAFVMCQNEHPRHLLMYGQQTVKTVGFEAGKAFMFNGLGCINGGMRKRIKRTQGPQCSEFGIQSRRIFEKWWAMTDSNRRHPRCKRGALPTELIARRVLQIVSAASVAVMYWYRKKTARAFVKFFCFFRILCGRSVALGRMPRAHQCLLEKTNLYVVRWSRVRAEICFG